MVRERYALPAYLSDLGGNDPAAHGGDPQVIMRIVSRYLHATPNRRLLPGPQSYVAGFRRFKEDLPGIAAGLDWGAAEVNPFANYRAYLLFLAEFIRTAKRVSAE
jgi:hypothetical protein